MGAGKEKTAMSPKDKTSVATCDLGFCFESCMSDLIVYLLVCLCVCEQRGLGQARRSFYQGLRYASRPSQGVRGCGLL
jgi:hypothetical protein